MRLGFRIAEPLGDRVIYRELFPRGITALDTLDEKTLGTRPTLSHVTARKEIMTLVETLKLPLDQSAPATAPPRTRNGTPRATSRSTCMT